MNTAPLLPLSQTALSTGLVLADRNSRKNQFSQTFDQY